MQCGEALSELWREGSMMCLQGLYKVCWRASSSECEGLLRCVERLCVVCSEGFNFIR